MSYGISFGVIDLVRRIISMTLVFVTCFFCFSPTLVRASFVDSYVSSNFAQFVMDGAFTAIGVGAGSYFGSPEIGAIVGHAVGAGINDIASWYAAGHTDQEVYDAYNTYVTDLQTDLGSTTLIDGGVRVKFSQTMIAGSNATISTQSENGSYDIFCGFSSTSGYVKLTFSTITVPFACYYTSGYSLDLNNCYVGTNKEFFTNLECASGQSIKPTSGGSPHLYIYVQDSGLASFSGYLYADLIPYTGVLPTTQDITINSRPTSIVLPVGYYDSNNTLQVVNDTTIVNETNNTYYNPVTDISNTFTDWSFDYSTRTYTLTLEDGSSVTVVYGDENITINEGDTTYNVYYLIPSEDPGGSGGSGDSSDTDSSGFWTWWKEEWTDFRSWLSGIFSGDGVPSAPDSSVLPGGADNPDTEEDESWSFLDLLIAVKDGIWKVIKGFISTAVNGIVGLIQSISNIGDYFDAFDSDNSDNILGIYNYGGEDIWD